MTPGDYDLTIADHASLHVTVYREQRASITGGGAPTGQLAFLDASMRVMPQGELVLNSVHVSKAIKVELYGVLTVRAGSLPSSELSMS